MKQAVKLIKIVKNYKNVLLDCYLKDSICYCLLFFCFCGRYVEFTLIIILRLELHILGAVCAFL